MAATANSVTDTALFVGDDLALDFVNTEYGLPTDRREVFGSDQQVLDWLARANVATAVENPASMKRGALLAAALELRDGFRDRHQHRFGARHVPLLDEPGRLALFPDELLADVA